MSESITLFSPAKLNLFFRVLRSREDSFHEIASLFQSISLGDILHISLSEKEELFCSDPSIPVDEKNLVLKAVRLFQKKTGLSFQVKIDLQKSIPVQSGMGGGSSNAATTLWGLNELFKTNFTTKQLQEISSEIGSDVPFFFSLGTAYCKGRGEKVENLDPLPQKALWIAKPAYGLGTPEVYRNCNPSGFLARDPKQVLKLHYEGEPLYFNDLETSAFELSPPLAKLKDQLLQSGFKSAVMTGSGTAFFCFGEKNKALIPGVDFFPVHFLNREKEKWYREQEYDIIH